MSAAATDRLAVLLGQLSLPWTRRLGALLGHLADLAQWRPALVTRRNLLLAGVDPHPTVLRRLARRSLVETGRQTLETLWVWRADPARVLASVTSVHGAGILEQALASGRGVLLLAPHLGNWEIACAWVASRHPLLALQAATGDPALDRWVIERRGRFGATLRPNDLAGVRALYRALAAGGMAALLPDQVATDGVAAPFFRRVALTTDLPRRALRATGAIPLLVWARRDVDGFALHFRSAEAICATLDDAGAAASRLNGLIEEAVREIPEQYQWEYKRYRHADPGRDPYKVLDRRSRRRMLLPGADFSVARTRE